MAQLNFGNWTVEMANGKVLHLSSLVCGPDDGSDPKPFWKKMVNLINHDLSSGVELPPPEKWAEEVVDAKLDGSGPRLSYLSLVWDAVSGGFPKERHHLNVKHLMRLRRYRNLTTSDFHRMNLPAGLVAAKLSTAPANVRTPLQRYIEDIDRWIAQGVGFLIQGATRAGKTGSAAILAKAAVSRGKSAYFTRVSELRDAIKFETPFSEDVTIWNRCRRVDFLVLDNLLAEDATLPYFNATALSDLVTFRGERRRATVVTTSLSSAALRSAFGTFVSSTSSYLVPLGIDGAQFSNVKTIQRELLGDVDG